VLEALRLASPLVLFWLCDVCFGCAMFVLVVRCLFWLCDVCFGCAMFVLVVRWEGLGFLSVCFPRTRLCSRPLFSPHFVCFICSFTAARSDTKDQNSNF